MRKLALRSVKLRKRIRNATPLHLFLLFDFAAMPRTEVCHGALVSAFLCVCGSCFLQGVEAQDLDHGHEDELAHLLQLRTQLHAQLREITNAIRNQRRKKRRLMERGQQCSVDELMHVAVSKLGA